MKHFFSIYAMACALSTLGTAQAQTDAIPMVEIPSGSFYMGTWGLGENYDEAPQHKVYISRSFRMGVTEVTNAQYEQFCPEHKALRGKNGFSKEDDEAVIYVSYNDAMAYCRWLSQKTGKTYRLPTEAEWEYACKAGRYWNFFMNDKLPAEYQKNQEIVSEPRPVSLMVGQTPANDWGLRDMCGNVEEWCLDWYGPYASGEQTDPVGCADGIARVTRGGSHNTPTEYLRSANRMAMLPDDKHCMTGFRVVEAEYPATQPIACKADNYAVSQNTWDWEAHKSDKALFTAPQVYVLEPEAGSGVPFYPHNHQPAITWCDNGDLLAIWFSTKEEKGREMVVLSSRLRAGSTEWEKPRLFYHIADRNLTGSSLLNDGKGTLYHINGVEAAGRWRNLMMTLRTSTDNGQTWSKPRIIEPEHTVRHQVIAGPTVTREGWIIQACDAGPGGADGTSLHISKDGGLTWNDQWDGSPKPEFKEGGTGTTIAGIHAGVVQLKDGRLMALGRNNSIPNAEGRLCMPMSISDDMGKTWHYSASEFPPIDGGQRAVLLRMNEGPLLFVSFTDHPYRTAKDNRGMTFTDPYGNTFKGQGMFAALSYDEGKTWPVKRLLTDGIYRFLNGGAWTQFFEMDAHRAEPRGYLAATQTPDNVVHLISSRFHYTFNLAWLEEATTPAISIEPFLDGIHHWNLEHKDRTYYRYSACDIRHIADNFLAYQNEDGGWPKNIDWLAALPTDSVKQALKERYRMSTLDNRNSFTQIEYLADAYNLTHDKRYRESAVKGLEYLLATQKQNGGWRGWDVDAITFNDEVTTGSLELFQKIVQGDKSFSWLSATMKKRIKDGYERGMRMILDCQVVQNGVKTAWAQQHDNETLAPVKARTYELPGITANESCDVLRLLMKIQKPTDEVKQAVKAGIAWLRKVEIRGLRVEEVSIPEEKIINHEYPFDRVEVHDAAARPIWARFYEVADNTPFMCTRAGQKVWKLADVNDERRTGYDWYGYWPETIFPLYEAWLKRIGE